MAKIGIYSDVHISHNSGNMPTYLENEIYTTRLDMCKKSIKWAYDIFAKNKVDTVVNCGDLYNSHVISSDEMHTLVHTINDIYKPYEILSWCPSLDVSIVGNHDKLNDTFNSLEFLKLCGYTQLVDKYMYFNTNPSDTCGAWDCYAVNFQEAKDFIKVVDEMLIEYPRLNSKAILFMHGDINGSTLFGSKKIENHIPTDYLAEHFDVIINGHIHCHELIYNKNDKKIYNVGSLTSHSFADSNNHVPACYIFDTDNGNLEQFVNPHSILFKSYNINGLEDIQSVCKDLKSTNNQIIVKIKCDFSLKEDIEKALSDIPNIIKYRFIFTYNKEVQNDNYMHINKDVDIESEFIKFLSNRDDLKGNIDEYITLLGGDK